MELGDVGMQFQICVVGILITDIKTNNKTTTTKPTQFDKNNSLQSKSRHTLDISFENN